MIIYYEKVILHKLDEKSKATEDVDVKEGEEENESTQSI
jgi:hypothetical protein